MMSFCADQENGGLIRDCRCWNDRQWMQLIGVSWSNVENDCPLYKWEGDDLRISFYPTAKELEVRAKSIAGKLCGKGGLSKAQYDALKEEMTLEQITELSDEQIAQLRHSKGQSYTGKKKGNGIKIEKNEKKTPPNFEKAHDFQNKIKKISRSYSPDNVPPETPASTNPNETEIQAQRDYLLPYASNLDAIIGIVVAGF